MSHRINRGMRDNYKDTTRTARESVDDVEGKDDFMWHEDEINCCNEGPKDGVAVNKPMTKSRHRGFN